MDFSFNHSSMCEHLNCFQYFIITKQADMSNQVRGIFILRVYLQGKFLELALLRQMVKTRGVPG